MNQHDLLDVMGEAQELYVHRAGMTKNRKNVRRMPVKRLVLIAVAAALAALLVGCGIVCLLRMEDWKITDREWDSYLHPGESLSQRILAVGGVQGTVNYQAAKEWYDFEIPYAQSHEWDEAFACPPEYGFYEPYSQEMVDKLEEITRKYGLKPMGSQVEGQSEKGLLAYLGIGDVLLPDAQASVSDLRAAYYEGGCLNLSGVVQMEQEGSWPHPIHLSWYFSPKDHFDSRVFVLDDPELWEEWNYTTKTGQNFLLLYKPGHWEAYAIGDRGDMTVQVYIQTAKAIYTNDRVSEEIMSQRDCEALLEVLDFSLRPQPGDPELLSGLPAGYDPSQRVQTQDGYTVTLESAVCDGNMAWITLSATIPGSGTKPQRVAFDHRNLFRDGTPLHPYMSAKYQETGENVICVYDPENPDIFSEGTELTLVLEGMHPAVSREQGYPWETDCVWNFTFTYDPGCDFRKLEFISEPTELPEEKQENMLTVLALSLQSRSASLHLEESLSAGELELCVVLLDGTGIPLRSHSGLALDSENTRCVINYVLECEIPLDQVDHILLSDGTKLYPGK